MPQNQLSKLRSSTEHLLTMAMENLYGQDKVIKAMGPATDNGFYFDFDSPTEFKLTTDNFKKIEKEMHRLAKLNLPISAKLVSPSLVKKLFKNNPYKLEWLKLIQKKQPKQKIRIVTIGQEGTDNYFPDICKDDHLKSTAPIKFFKLLSIAGAYWHGDEKNKMLTRIYGTAFNTQKELKDYLWNLEEAKKRDHRKLGKKLELFTISDQVGQGLILWLPKGNIIKENLEHWVKQVEAKWGYQRVTTPNIGKASLYHTSGHLPYYKKDMYPSMKLKDGQEYLLKPMNCPHHHQIYSALKRSYKDLPLRLAEYGTCYRYEASGELFGLMRVRGFSQNDAHIYCTLDQAVDEFVNVMKLHQYFYKTLGIKKYHLELALRDPKDKAKYHGNEAMWQLAEKLMKQAVKRVNISMTKDIGSAAFYGPKIDFIVESSIGRQFAISTNQIDLYMGNRFNLKYTDKDGQEKTPVIIHRAPLGSHERFIGFLIEHFGGAFPVWLSPIQVVIIPISNHQNAYAQKIANHLQSLSIRVKLDNHSNTLGAKIRQAETQKSPYILILGEKEAASGQVAVRQRANQNLGTMDLAKFTKKILTEIEKKIIS